MQLLHACTLAVTHHQAIGQGSARDRASTRLPTPGIGVIFGSDKMGSGGGSEAMPTTTHQSPPWFVASTRLFPPPGRKWARWPWLRPAAEFPDPSRTPP